ncbi:dynein regulatory complex subunit 3 [Eucyclogobius newberryi]|uniref:dynein regulatory complex subunit 3 n=1 Tax=Eucyclogobius newberryi TaxID=166745 RepID=UPI003B59ED21
MSGKGEKARITEEHLRAIVAEQFIKGPAGRNQVERLEFYEVQKLDLGSKHISRIERLWEFTSLTTLHLNNNYIQKMEGLSRLTNLTSLNLSFNNIMKIEGLESLKKLEELNLRNNKISALENLDSLEKLVSLNMANNILQELSQMLYLKNFKNLLTLNFCGNPLSEEENYKLHIIAFFPNLKYLDYTYINRETKKQASVKFHIELQKLDLEEAEKEKKTEALKTQESDLQLHAEAFVESLNGSFLFEHMFKYDPLANKLQSVPEISAQQEPYPLYLLILNVSLTFKEKMTGLCVQLFETGLVEHKRRQAEVNSFFTGHRMTTAEIMQKETELLGAFEKYFKELKNESATTFQTFQASAHKDELNKLQKHLLTLEFKLISQIEMMIKKLDVALAEMVGAFCDTAQEIYPLRKNSFAQCRELENKYHEKVQEIIAVTIEEVTRDHGVEDLSDDVKMVFLDKETVMGALTTAHENHLLALQDRENLLITRANAWKSKCIKKLQEKELQRNRKTLSHIAKYVDHYEEELHKINR